MNRIKNGFIIETLRSVDFQKIVKLRGKVVKICEVVIYAFFKNHCLEKT